MKNVLPKHFRFIDLFAGIGGFHQAMKEVGGKCVYAIEINKETAKTYIDNYQFSNVLGDIVNVDVKTIPDHDVLCAGFPCQPFSKAGKQKGFKDKRGTLFFNIIDILKDQMTRKYGGVKVLILENVRNLISHNNHKTWTLMKQELIKIGYNVIENPLIVSPHDYGIPQLRERAIILAVKKDLFNKTLKLSIERKKRNSSNMNTILINNKNNEYDLSKYRISKYQEKILIMWDEFIKGINEKVIGFPIWADWFKNKNISSKFPKWKLEFINKNKQLYKNNKKFIDKWLIKYKNLKNIQPTERKFEWQVQGKLNSVFDGIIQFRPSGIRVKLPTEFPALVAMVHVPIIGKEKRYITPREAANLQSFPSNFKIPQNDTLAYKQFGNAVNVKVIKNVFKTFIEYIKEGK